MKSLSESWYQGIIPVFFMVSSNSRSSRSFSSRFARIARVSQPWMVLASAQRCRPLGVLGPVEAPPWVLHTFLPLMAALRHCSPLRFDLAWQRGTLEEPKISIVVNNNTPLHDTQVVVNDTKFRLAL